MSPDELTAIEQRIRTAPDPDWGQPWIVIQRDTPALLEALRAAWAENARYRAKLTDIANAEIVWSDNVGSYAGGETWAGFAHRLIATARAVLAAPGAGEETTT